MKHAGGHEFQFGGGDGLDACAAAAAAGVAFPLEDTPAARIEGGGDDPLSCVEGRRDAAAPPLIVSLTRENVAILVARWIAAGNVPTICPAGGRGLLCVPHALHQLPASVAANRARGSRAGRLGGKPRQVPMTLQHPVRP